MGRNKFNQGSSCFPLLGFLSWAAVASADVDFSVDGRPYRLVTTPRTWAAAEADAVALGGHLAHIDNAAENAAIFSAISAAVPSTSAASDGGGAVYVWIGGQEIVEGTYAWADAPATPFWTGGNTGGALGGHYVNWGRGLLGDAGPEPDNFLNLQNSVGMGIEAWPVSGSTKLGQPGQWNDIAGSNSLAYVVEFDGLYASVRMRHGGVDKGIFTAKLFPEKAPLAVANFVSLAEGVRSWTDPKSGLLNSGPFYNGIIWHRIIPGFMCQGGDPKGTGTGGPGYTFPDQFDDTLRHNKVGLLSMANSGPHTNGSQFFVTVANTPHLDDKHTIFGEVITGYTSVVQPLSLVPTGAGDRPTLPVVMESVTIHRAGTIARTFDSAAEGLPTLRGVQALARKHPTGGKCLLEWPQRPHSAANLFLTTDLANWSGFSEVELQSTASLTQFDPTNLLSTVGNPGRAFFRITEAESATPYFAPASVEGHRLEVVGSITMRFDLTAARSGTWSIVSPAIAGSIIDYVWDPNPHGARFRCLVSGLSFGTTPVSIIDQGVQFTTATTGRTNLYMNSSGGGTLFKLIRGNHTLSRLP